MASKSGGKGNWKPCPTFNGRILLLPRFYKPKNRIRSFWQFSYNLAQFIGRFLDNLFGFFAFFYHSCEFNAILDNHTQFCWNFSRFDWVLCHLLAIWACLMHFLAFQSNFRRFGAVFCYILAHFATFSRCGRNFQESSIKNL